MIGTVLRVSWLNLKRDRVAQALSFVLPVVFFSIFAVVFGGANGGETSKVAVVVVDEDQSDASRRFIRALSDDPALTVRPLAPHADGSTATATDARQIVAAGKVSVAIVVRRGFAASFGSFGGSDVSAAGVQLLADRSDPVAPQMVAGLIQRAAMTAAPDLFIERGLEMFEKYGGPLTASQRSSLDEYLPQLRALTNPASAPASGPSAVATGGAEEKAPAFSGPIGVEVVDVLGQQDKSPAVAFYAAGTAVMFLLFSMSGAGGTLLEEEESGVLERLLASRVTMGKLLAGKWLFLSAMGAVQVTIMFIWGALVFGLKLWTPGHLAGFAAMTIVTAAAAAGMGLVLATLSRSRAQLSGLSTIIILVMSAVGGSMFPRFLMPEVMKKVGLCTFNAWALDGYQKVFWYDQSVWQLWPQVGVLAGLTVIFLALARVFARRWETI